MRMGNEWTKEEIDLLRKYFPITYEKDWNSVMSTRSYSAARSRAQILNIKKAVGFGAKKKWQQNELDYLKLHYAETLNSELRAKFNCSEKSLYSAAFLLDVKKSEGYMSRICGPNITKAGEKTRFKKGFVPKNKGKKWDEYLPKEMQEKLLKTTYKKGIVPANSVPIGHERISRDGYLEVKVASGKQNKNFKLKHRLVWEENFGPIPPKHQVRFIDGNKLNFELSNLKLVSQENSLRINSMSDSSVVKRFMGIKDEVVVNEIINKNNDLIKLKRNAILLNQKIKQNERKTSIIL